MFSYNECLALSRAGRLEANLSTSFVKSARSPLPRKTSNENHHNMFYTEVNGGRGVVLSDMSLVSYMSWTLIKSLN